MRRLIPFILGIFLILLLVCAPYIPLDRFRSQLADNLSQRLHHKVVISRLEAHCFPPSLRLVDVNLLNPAADAPLLQAKQMEVKLNLLALVQLKILPQSLNVHDWQASVHRKVDGRWDWDEWLAPTAQLGGQAGWPLKGISFDRGIVHAIDPYGPGPEDFSIQVMQGKWESDRKYISMDGVLTSLPAQVTFQFQGSGAFMTNPQWTAVLSLTDENRQWKLDCKTANGHSEATGESAQWRFDTAYAFLRYYSRLPLPPATAAPNSLLQDWKAHFDWQASTLTFNQTAALAGGHAEIAGVVQYSPSQSKAHVDLALQDAKIQGIEAALWGGAPFEGAATGLAKFDLMLSSQPWSSVTGQGALELKDGRYFWPEVSAKSLAKAHTMRYLTKKFPGFLQSGLNFSKASVHWQARRGMFSMEDAFFNLGDIQAALAGTYDAAHRGLDLYTRVQVKEHNADLLNELPPVYVDKGQNPPRIQPMHGHLQGTPAEWYLRATRAGKVPPATLNQLSRTVRNK